MKRIAIIGSTGMLGKPVTCEFVSRGYTVTAMVRNPDAARIALPAEVTLVKGDVENPRDVSTLLRDHDKLYLNLNLRQNEKPSDFHTEGQGLHTILKVASEQRLKRIGFVSSLVMNYQGMNGFDWWVFRIKHNAVKMIKESGIAYRIVDALNNYPEKFEAQSAWSELGKPKISLEAFARQ